MARPQSQLVVRKGRLLQCRTRQYGGGRGGGGGTRFRKCTPYLTRNYVAGGGEDGGVARQLDLQRLFFF